MTDTPAEKAEKAAIRRRWISLGEFVAVAGLIISALALWNGYTDRRADQAEKQAEKAQASRARNVVLLTATPAHGGETLTVRDTQHPVQSISVAFPAALGIAPQGSTGDLEIRADWVSGALLSATDKGPDVQKGRLPVLITADYWDGDDHVTDKALYDLLWRTEGRFLRGRMVRLTGMVLRARHDASQAQMDAAWKQVGPKPDK